MTPEHVIAIEQAHYIFDNSDRPEGMVRVWEEQARLGRITYGQMQAMQARYIELGGQVHIREDLK